MSELPLNFSNLKKSVKCVPYGTPYSLLLRHGNREPFQQGTSGNDYMLNEAGVQNSVKFGLTFLRDSDMTIIASPVPRCVQTGQLMARGAGKEVEVQTSNYLGSPGPFMVNKKLGGPYFINNGPEKTIMEILGGMSIPGMLGCKEGSEVLMRYLLQDRTGAGCKIYITHDAIAMPFIYHYTGEKFGKDNWLNFLDGVVIYRTDDERRIVRDGKTYSIDMGEDGHG